MKKINGTYISSQIINTMEASNEPWGIKDKNSRFIYANLALRSIQNIPTSFDYEGLFDDELPWSGAEFAKEFIDHDKIVITKGKRICSLETYTYGKGKILSSYFQEKLPLYNDAKECIGIFFHGWKAKDFSLINLHQYYNELPTSIIFHPPTDSFTQREWDIIFFFLQKYTRKQIGKILNISYHTVESHMTNIYHKIGVDSNQQLEEYCLINNFKRYVPEKFLLS
ncbi:helix-turn-helix transcriptional regulator [Photorhabdus kleinii]|uniref:helix-turn-helix transcriptional regulator n=1 Tax=Photorhabdus kleinii TaxID=768034 RepID=UPI0021D4B12C|nr:PAS and helix-turn-helix domain-containing protein [Photorhabdus kleinii]MCT8344067.1 helix-turn-helix transcriptional regulator [Photorhabdus kleinii]